MTQAPAILIPAGDAPAREILSKKGYVLHTAATGEECLARAASERPDVVLIPWEFPDKSGREVCRHLHDFPGPRPSVVLRVPARVPDLESCSAEGYLPEKAGAALLLATISAVLRCRDAERQLAASQSEAGRSREDFSRFAARVTHDFAEPLRSMTALSQLLEAGPVDRLSADEKLYLQYLNSGMERVRGVLQSILAYTQPVAAGHGPVPLSLCATGALQSLGKRIEETGAEVHIEEPLPVVRGNAQSIQTLLRILIENALTYSHPDSKPAIAVKAVRHSGREWLVSVADHGIGIPRQYHGSVFEAFQRLHGREIPGSGLGLTLARKIVEAHEGRIWLASEPGEGTTVFFTLPAYET
jgi:light-regulated signal transduction histidine kinase (bacteriophytochrome)